MPKSLDKDAEERLERALRVAGNNTKRISWAVDSATADIKYSNPARYVYLQGVLPSRVLRRILARKEAEKRPRRRTYSRGTLSGAKGHELYHKKRSGD